jgi:hypothetical protein
MRNIDHWLTHDPALDIEDVFCPECNSCAEVIEDADEDGPCASLHCASCEAREKGSISLSLLEDIELGGVNPKDAPDYVDAFIASASWINYPEGDDPELTEEQLGRIDSEQVAEYVQQKLNM